ncbi:unnamed protein product [Adineta steineri]|uniref:Saposin B-type domain-containing protein n=1 Tax=Adineta steineri TaxID=433720 RepID=A0A818MAG4_9BILA|nr:unnamed protein product [Adineta steineri]CAF3578181.1 unnamed protein product [Adineta steineri]
MYKALICILLVIIGATYASYPIAKQPKKLQRLPSNYGETKVGIDLCPECIEEAVEIINVILNIILDEGIIETCGELCGLLANKTGSKIIGDVCDVACEAFGLDEFVKALIKADLDPIWYCEMADLCPINDHGDAKFTNFQITPKTAPEGSTFVFDCSFTSVNGTGTGVINIVMIDPKNRTAANLYWFEARKPGTYPEKIGLQTLFELNCDPTQELCDGWEIGTYNVTAQVCNGECGSHHPHSSTYDTATGSFEITKKKNSFLKNITFL